MSTRRLAGKPLRIAASRVRAGIRLNPASPRGILSSRTARFLAAFRDNQAMITDYQAKYYAHCLTREGGDGPERLQQSLLSASVDLNPHQIEAALFALHSPLSKGCILADEVGLGKTIEAGLILCQLWAERKRRLLVVCPAALRRQWQAELQEKFNLPAEIVDAKRARELKREGKDNPFERPAVAVVSYNYAAKESAKLRVVQWDYVVMDEAHKLRNSHQASNRIGSALRFALKDRRKALLTATPIQNALTELYGVSTVIDEDLFGDLASFRARYVNQGGDLNALRDRLRDFCRRTLRKDVQEYVKYTERHAMTEKFEGSNAEQKLYDDVSAYLQDETTYAFPSRQRAMLVQLVRKLLASSPAALAGTLQKIKARLDALRPGGLLLPGNPVDIVGDDEEDLVDAAEEDAEDTGTDAVAAPVDAAPASSSPAAPAADGDGPAVVVDAAKLDAEKRLVEDFILRAQAIGTDSKTQKLLSALAEAFPVLEKAGAARKAVVFTESVRSMMFLKRFLEANGYAGKVVTFSGGGRRDPDTEAVYRVYKAAHPGDVSAKDVMVRHAIVEKFRDDAEILLATEAGAEGINLQFCSLVVNYDLPWNPQRVEQRIGRCHRYGQKFDVTVVNFLNTRNAADVRIFELLNEKFNLFGGLFGASDDVLGVTDSNGVPFEKRVNEILQKCRTPDEINAAFDKLRDELADEIKKRMDATRAAVLDNLDATVAGLLRDSQAKTRLVLDEASRQFWALTKHMLRDHARDFDDETFSFTLPLAPDPAIPTGLYTFSKSPDAKGMPYRPNAPLGEWVIAAAKALHTPEAEVSFDVSSYRMRLFDVERLKGKGGVLRLDKLRVEGLGNRDYLLFSALDDAGKPVSAETMASMFMIGATAADAPAIPQTVLDALSANAAQFSKATIEKAAEADNVHFQEETNRIEQWSRDRIAVAEHKIEQARARKLELENAIRKASTVQEQLPLQKELDAAIAALRRARSQLFDVQDETDDRRKELLDALQAQLAAKTISDHLFAIRWKVV